MSYGSEPQYRQIYNKLRQDIASGRYPVGGVLPGDKQMAEIFSVNHLTVRNALTRLVDEGCIIRHRGRGRGTTVVRKPEDNNISEDKLLRLGLLIPNQNGPNREFIRGIENVTTYQKVQLVRLERPDAVSFDGNADIVRMIMGEEIDGVIMFGSFWQQDLVRQIEEAERLEKLKVPVVVLDRFEYVRPVDCVCVDDKEGMRKAAEHLISLGHRQLVYIRFKELSLRHQSRLAGFHEALAGAGNIAAEEVTLDTNDRIGNARILAEYFSSNRNRFTACLCGNDYLADLAIGALETVGVAVPKDMAVMGYDCLPDAYVSMSHHGISSVDRQRFEVGRNAAKRLLDRISDPGLVAGVKSFLPTSLLVRATCGGKKADHPAESHEEQMDY